MKKGYSKMILLLKSFWLDTLFKSFYQKKGLPGLIPLLFLHGSPTKYPKSLSLRFGVHQTSSKKVTETIFFIFSSLWRPLMTSQVFKLQESQICVSRDFQNGMALAYWPKNENSRDPRSFDSYLVKFSGKVWGSGMASFRGQEIFPMMSGVVPRYI